MQLILNYFDSLFENKKKHWRLFQKLEGFSKDSTFKFVHAWLRKTNPKFISEFHEQRQSG